MKMDSLSRLFPLALTVFAVCVAMPARAQDDLVTPNASQPSPSVQPVQPSLSMPPDNAEVTILRDEYAGKYNLSTLENLSKLYWRLGAFDLEDDLAIGNYIKINDCKIFSEYLNDDLEWKQIVNVMRGHLKQNSAAFPLNFQFLLQLHLGRYEAEKGGFPLVDRTAFVDAKRIEVDSIDQSRDVCFDAGAIKDYPKSVVILMPEPFTLDFVKLDEHVAQAYILRKKSEFSKLSDEMKVKAYERDAFLRLRVTFSQYHGNLRGEMGKTMAILYGSIDGYEIFEDSGQKRLMVSVDVKKDKSAAVEMMSAPSEEPSQPAAQMPAMGFTSSQ